MIDTIAEAIAEARIKRGMSPSDLARAMSTSPQAVYNWEKGKNRPTTDKLLAMAELLRVDSSSFLKGEVVLLQAAADQAEPPLLKPPRREIEIDRNAPAFDQLGGPRNVAELGIAVGGDDGDFTLNGEVVDYVPRPRALAHRDIFAVRVKNDSMEPRFYEGELLYVERKRLPQVGDDLVVEFLPTEEGEPGPAFIKQLVSRNSERVVVRQFNPPKEILYDRRRIKDLYRVVPRNESYGV